MNVPVLRFNEFGGDWKHISLGEITQTLTSGSRDWARYYSNTGSKFVRMTNLSRDGIQLKLDDLKYVNVKTDSAEGKRTSLVHGDILISITAELGKIGWIPPDFGVAFINQHTALLRLDNVKVDTRCVAHILVSPKVNKIINKMNDSGAKAGLNLPTIKAIKIYLPEKNEQTKIANFLTAVDERISQLTQKLELLSKYKKGVMQKIFSQELRFKDDNGLDFPEWCERTLGEVGEIVTGKTPSTTDPTLWDGDVQFVTPTDINDGKYQFKTCRTVARHRKLKVLPENSIMFTCIASIGKMSISTKPCITNQQINTLIPTSMYNNEYVYYALLNITEFIKSTQSSSTLPIIKKSDFSKFIIPEPTKAEQTKIANFLKAVDDKISATQAQLDAVKQYKQGLLKQMFV